MNGTVPPVLSYQYSWLEYYYCIRNHDWYLLSYPISVHELYFIPVWQHKASVCFQLPFISVLVITACISYTILPALMSGIPYMYQYSWLVLHSCISSHNWYLLFNPISTSYPILFYQYSCLVVHFVLVSMIGTCSHSLSVLMTGISLFYQ